MILFVYFCNARESNPGLWARQVSTLPLTYIPFPWEQFFFLSLHTKLKLIRLKDIFETMENTKLFHLYHPSISFLHHWYHSFQN